MKWEAGKKQALSMLVLLPASGAEERDPLTSSATTITLHPADAVLWMTFPPSQIVSKCRKGLTHKPTGKKEKI